MATALLLVLASAGCGGDDDGASTGPAPPQPPRDEYVVALDAVCEEAGELERAWDADQKRIHSLKGLIRHFRFRNEGGRTLLARYERLVPPPRYRAFHRRYVDTIRDQIELTDRALRALKAGDDRTYAKLTRKLGAAILRRTDLVASQPADFEHCGQP